ncbi:MAG: deoxyribose-phosphate aldolase, partial [Bacteroidaceae bacterium]|nr:deoxyribose-phosphate aldolase [Bacteroidaceae bacterium]
MEEQSKYDKVLAMYETNLDDAQVKAEVKELLDKHLQENMTPEVKKFLFGSIELTTLKTTDSE